MMFIQIFYASIISALNAARSAEFIIKKHPMLYTSLVSIILGVIACIICNFFYAKYDLITNAFIGSAITLGYFLSSLSSIGDASIILYPNKDKYLNRIGFNIFDKIADALFKIIKRKDLEYFLVHGDEKEHHSLMKLWGFLSICQRGIFTAFTPIFVFGISGKLEVLLVIPFCFLLGLFYYLPNLISFRKKMLLSAEIYRGLYLGIIYNWVLWFV